MTAWLTPLVWGFCGLMVRDMFKHLRKVKVLRKQLGEALDAVALEQEELKKLAAVLREREEIMGAMFVALADARAGLIETVERYKSGLDDNTIINDTEEDS